MAQESTEIEITTIGRRSGRNHSHPVWFVREGKSTFLLPITGHGSQWYRNLENNPTIKLGSASAKARLITDQKRVAQVFDEFASKYGADDMRRFYPRVEVAVEVRDS
ncbi:nitroreductase/quinone reductase family protein [Asanoa iriomotensis]|uniref:Deazaflavin-dependent oxidoreductase (Nitroreductase family) n=1 Tax=Asanoa iriomotensis TaxID=234613 RepID=A0ABQ4CAL9_9ACTN|nr:nitroreductase/quinone reductase family protein [Asanoa iriomotensis]GIF59802.1 hypothetical protein Air01nite_58970 [Asanoa iriomotensis]